VDAHRRLIRIAAAQHGLVTADQAAKAGLSREEIRWLTRSGRWIALRPRVYAVAGMPPTAAQAVAAAVYAAGDRAWASHATAGVLWGMPRLEAPTVELVTPLDRKVGLTGVTGHRSGALFTKDLTTHRRIPVTSPERTLVDLSGRLTQPALGRILDDGLRTRTMRLDRLSACVARLLGAPARKPSLIQALLADDCRDMTRATVTWRPACCVSSSPTALRRRSSSIGCGSAEGRFASIWPIPKSCWPWRWTAGSTIGPGRRSTTIGSGAT
jgi:hypothetical protein